MTTSVLVATYNGERFIEEQLSSILDQSVPVDQVLICDDGSSDGTVELIRRFLSGHSPAGWELVSNDLNLGPSMNVLTHISALEGDVIFLADQDDVWEKSKVERMAAFMATHPDTALTVSRTSLIDAAGSEIGEGPLKDQVMGGSRIDRGAAARTDSLAFSDFIGHSTVPLHAMCVRGSVVRRIVEPGEFPELSLSLGADWYIGIWSAVLGDCYLLPEALVRYRVHDANISLGRVRKTTVLSAPSARRLAMLREAMRAHISLLNHATLSKRLTNDQKRAIVRMCDFLDRRIEFAESPNPRKALALLSRGDLYVRSSGRLVGGVRMFGADVMYAYNINWRLRKK